MFAWDRETDRSTNPDGGQAISSHDACVRSAADVFRDGCNGGAITRSLKWSALFSCSCRGSEPFVATASMSRGTD